MHVLVHVTFELLQGMQQRETLPAEFRQRLAAIQHLAQLADELEQLIELGQLPDLQALSDLLVPPPTTLPRQVR